MVDMLRQQLAKIGTLFKASVIPKISAKKAHSSILIAIQECAKDLNCPTSEYLSSVSRWAYPSPIVLACLSLITEKLQPSLENALNSELKLSKINVITKNRYAPHAIAAHQDVSYQDETMRYDFSVWLALNHINLSEGPLECLPGSHLLPIQPPIDFWQPGFTDAVRCSKHWKNASIRHIMQPGDAVLFHENTWHASGPNTSLKDRYALVTRWQWVDDPLSKKNPIIPKKQIVGFGMWNCYEHTILLLERVLKTHEISAPKDFISLLELAQEHLHKLVPVSKHQNAMSSLKRVKLLHLASYKHHAGDSQGKIYAELWDHLLQFLPGADKILAPRRIKEETHATSS